MMIRTFHGLRRITGALLLAVLIGLPFLRINGESALRFDVPSLRLMLFGTVILMQDFFIILIAVIFLTFSFLFATTILGRVWCGWLCPQTVLTDATSFVDTSRRRGYAALVFAALAGIAASAVIAAACIGYFVSPYDLPLLLRNGGTAATIIIWSWVSLVVILFLDITALRRKFCASVCPYAKMQSVLFDDRTLVVAFDESRADQCRECEACIRACPVDIDIRKGLQSACIHCAECVDACAAQMARRNQRSLIGYTRGLAGSRGAGIRINPLITGILTAISFAFLLYLAISRAPFDMSIRLEYRGGPEAGSDGSVINNYLITLRNVTTRDLDLDLTASAAEGWVSLTPGAVHLKQGAESVTLPVSVILKPPARLRQGPVKITITIRSVLLGKSVSRSVLFVVPRGE